MPLKKIKVSDKEYDKLATCSPCRVKLIRKHYTPDVEIVILDDVTNEERLRFPADYCEGIYKKYGRL